MDGLREAPARAEDVRVSRIMAVASVALVVVAGVAVSQESREGPRTAFLRAGDPGALVHTPTTFKWTPPADAPPLGTALRLPVGAEGVRLSAIPDALLNDPPAARFSAAVSVRGRTGIAALDLPVVLAWSESGYWYELSSTDRTLIQLIELASALE